MSQQIENKCNDPNCKGICLNYVEIDKTDIEGYEEQKKPWSIEGVVEAFCMGISYAGVKTVTVGLAAARGVKKGTMLALYV